jgi:pSer/pThr/pTyr-binding forkhead associated (FHA) protein
MWRLTIEDDEGQRTSLDLSQSEYTIGRAEDNDVRLTERNISRRHCVVRENGDGGWEIVDNGSYNGTFVNGQRVTGDGTALSSGDIINIGDYRVEMLDAHQPEAAEADTRQRRPDRLVMVIGPSPGVEYALAGDRLNIGRAEEASVSINHASVSRLHAELHNLGHGRWEVVDQGSSNGIRINGVELRRGIIEPGDALELGDVRLRFVAAGKFFRPAVDLSQQLPALPFDGMTATAAHSSGAQRGWGLFAVLLVVLGGAAVAGYVMFSRPNGISQAAPDGSASVKGTADPRQALDDARAAADAGDLAKAHSLIELIAEESPLRETDELRSIEDKWADEMFAKADKAQDPDEKVRIYTEIVDAVSVSNDKRKEAARRSLAVKPIEDLDDDPEPAPPTNPVPTRPSDDDDGYPVDPLPGSNEKPPAPAPSAKPSSGGGEADLGAEKRRLLNKLASGNATCPELLQLKSLAMLDGDRATRGRAVAEFNAKCK